MTENIVALTYVFIISLSSPENRIIREVNIAIALIESKALP
jgi:hypothetical protein